MLFLSTEKIINTDRMHGMIKMDLLRLHMTPTMLQLELLKWSKLLWLKIEMNFQKILPNYLTLNPR